MIGLDEIILLQCSMTNNTVGYFIKINTTEIFQHLILLILS